MRIIKARTINEFAERHPAARPSLTAWLYEVRRAAWRSMSDIKSAYASASVIDNERVIFNIAGNRFRLIVKIWFPGQQVYVKWFGTHAEYDRIDVKNL